MAATPSPLYRPHGEEVERLTAQSDLHRAFDIDLQERALHEMQGPLTVVDLGCARGDRTVDRFTGSAFDRVIGLDRDAAAVEIAQARFGDDRFSFHHFDIESSDAAERLGQLVGPGHRPVLLTESYVLLHLADPISALKALKAALPLGSRLILREGDDGSMSCHPDPNGSLDRIIELSELVRSSNRDQARRLPSQLVDAGMPDFELHSYPFFLSNMNAEERHRFFHVWFSHRINSWEERAQTNAAAAANLVTLRRCVDDLYKRSQERSFFFLALTFGALVRL